MEAGGNKLKVKRDILGFMALGSAALALAGAKLAPHSESYARDAYHVARAGLNHEDAKRKKVHYTPAKLSAMPGQRVIAQQGDGFDKLALRVNPDADISTSGAGMDLRQYLRQELEDQAEHSELWRGDRLCVPRVPHERPEPPIPPSARC